MQTRASLTRWGERRPIKVSRYCLQVKDHALSKARAATLERKRVLLKTLWRWLAHGWPRRSFATAAQELDS